MTGEKTTLTKTVTEQDTALAVGSGDLQVLATPVLTAWLEEAAAKTVQPFLEEGLHTVGTMILLKHLAATPVGSTVTVTAEVAAVDGKRYDFALSAHDEKDKIAEGEHSRFAVNGERFLQKAYDKLK